VVVGSDVVGVEVVGVDVGVVVEGGLTAVTGGLAATGREAVVPVVDRTRPGRAGVAVLEAGIADRAIAPFGADAGANAEVAGAAR